MKNIILLFLGMILFSPAFLTGYSGEVVRSFDLPSAFPTGLTFDGDHLWLADRKTDKIYCLNKETGDVVRVIDAPAYWPMGLTWDGESLWNADVKGGVPLAENYAGVIYSIDPEDGTILKTVPAPAKSPRGLAWDGKYLWCTDNASDEIIQFDPDDGTTIKSFKSPAKDPQGLTFDGKYLWVSDRMKNEIYMVDPESGCVIIIFDAPGPYPRGLSYDGEFLWVVDYQSDKLYKLTIGNNEKFRRSDAYKAKITYTHQTTNFGPGTVTDLDIHLAIPVDRDNQTITGEIEYSPTYTDIVTDKWEQKTAHFQAENLKVNGIHEIKMTSKVTLYNTRYFIYPDKVGSLEEIPSEIKERYLENNAKYQIGHPVIKNALKEALGEEKHPYWIARKLYNYLLDHMYYEMVGGWNTAPTVLERGNGSCSEYSFVFISLCRAAGLPARYVGSVALRGDEASLDDVFHRWVEIYLPNYGWIPVDPSRGDKALPRDQADSFGFLKNSLFITTQSGGGSETMAWTYNSNAFWKTEPKTHVVIEYFADWEPMK